MTVFYARICHSVHRMRIYMKKFANLVPMLSYLFGVGIAVKDIFTTLSRHQKVKKPPWEQGVKNNYF